MLELMEEIIIQRNDSKASVRIRLDSLFPGVKIAVGRYGATTKYKIHYGLNDTKGTYTEVWKYVGGRMIEYQQIRDRDGQVVRTESIYRSNPPRKHGEYIDIFTWDDENQKYNRKTYFRRKRLIFWGEPVPHDGPII